MIWLVWIKYYWVQTIIIKLKSTSTPNLMTEFINWHGGNANGNCYICVSATTQQATVLRFMKLCIWKLILDKYYPLIIRCDDASGTRIRVVGRTGECIMIPLLKDARRTINTITPMRPWKSRRGRCVSPSCVPLSLTDTPDSHFCWCSSYDTRS